MLKNITKRKGLPLVPALVLCAAAIILCTVFKETDLGRYIERVADKTD